MTKIAIIIGSTRPGRIGSKVAEWVQKQAADHAGAEFEVLDLSDFDLPLLDEPAPAAMGQYSRPHTHRWAETIAAYDGFIFVTPEYNHSMPASLKNAIDYLYAEWRNKAAAFVSYGVDNGARAIEHLRPVLTHLDVATIGFHVALSLYDDFENFSEFRPRDIHLPKFGPMLDQLILWANALRAVRSTSEEPAIV